MKSTLIAKVITLAGAGVLLQGCLTSTAVTSNRGALRPYHKPLEGWDEQILAKYEAGSLDEYTAQSLRQMGFLEAYERDFPPARQRSAFASAKSQRAYEAQVIAEAERTAAKKRVTRLETAVAALNMEIKSNLGSTSESKIAYVVDVKSQLQKKQAELDAATAESDEKERLYQLAKGSYSAASVEFKSSFMYELYMTEPAAKMPNDTKHAVRTTTDTESPLPQEAASTSSPKLEETDRETLQIAQIKAVRRLGMFLGAVDSTEDSGGFKFESIDEEKLVEIDSYGVPYVAQMTAERNRILNELTVLAVALHKARDHVLVYGRAKSNIFFTTIQIAATGVASVTRSEDGARSLAAFATALAGVKESIDKELFFQQNTTTLLQMMEADRAKHLGPLVEGMAKDAEQYPLEKGLSDYARYLTAGGLTDAIRDLSKEAAESAAETNAHLEELIEAAGENLTHIQEAKKEKATQRAADRQALIDKAAEIISGQTVTGE